MNHGVCAYPLYTDKFASIWRQFDELPRPPMPPLSREQRIREEIVKIL